jgi:glycerol uptake facilitator-like aquaporin
MALYSSSTGGAPARPLVADLVGTFILVFVGCSVAVAGTLERPVAGPPDDSLAVALAFGIALVAVVAAIGHVSGGHVNPAVTIGQAAIGQFPWRSVPGYLGAQLAGAIIAAFASWLWRAMTPTSARPPSATRSTSDKGCSQKR